VLTSDSPSVHAKFAKTAKVREEQQQKMLLQFFAVFAPFA
jgi:hypothetical protein